MAGRELSWGVPATHAWLLTPEPTAAARTTPDKPAILLLHAHDGVKFYGKEKMADGPDGPDGIAPCVAELRKRGYDGMAVAAELVRAGFAVLVHDVFPWGSRRVEWAQMPQRARTAGLALWPAGSMEAYEAAAREHEHGLAKVAALRGESLAASAVKEDLVALAVLRSLHGVDPNRIAALGFSGGGARAVHLLACTDALKAVVVTAMVSTFADIADGHADDTTWLMITPGLPAVCDWPEVASSAAPMPMLVQFAEQDSHFGLSGMRDAEAMMQREYGADGALTTQWFDSDHHFSADMSRSAIVWLQDNV